MTLKNIFKDPNEAREIISADRLVDQAYIDNAQAGADQLFRTVTLSLTNAKTDGAPFEIKFPFRSVFVPTASDSSTTVNMRPFTSNNANAPIPLTQNASLQMDRPIKGAQFTWDAQSGKEITLFFILQGVYRPGSLFTEVASAVEGNNISVLSPLTLTTTAQEIFPEDLTRTVANYSASGAFLISNTSGGTYFPINALDGYWKNTAQIFGKTAAGTVTLNRMVES